MFTKPREPSDFAERNFVKKQEIEENTYLFFIYAFLTSFFFFLIFFFFYPDEIVTEYVGNVEVLSISRFAYLKPYNKQLNNLVCSGFTVKFQASGWNFLFMDLAQRLGPKSKISSLRLEFYSKALAPGY